MSCSTTSDSPAVSITCEQPMDLQFAEIKLKLDDLIYKEQVNQLRILGVESTLHTILNKVCCQRVCVSTSCQTEEQLADDSCYTLLKSSTHINRSSNPLQVEDNELNLEELQRIFEDIPSSSSSAGENEMSTTNASSEQPLRRANNCKKYRSQPRVFYQCSHCKRKFSRKDEMLLHERVHDYVKCEDCSRVFASRGNLAKHRRFCFGRQKERLLLDETSRTIKDEENSLSSGAEKESPIDHTVEVVATSSSSADENEMSTSDASQEQPIHRKFSRKIWMSLPERTHVDPSLKCDKCLRVFTYYANAVMHRRFCSYLPKEKRFSFVCTKCGKSFPTRETRKYHSECHRERKLKCVLCQKAFLRPSQLTRHMITHTGARPYCCKFCRKRFGTSIEKSSHERMHVKPLKCET